ncbi:hypothetical protein [Streptomyces sp. Tu 3180]|uniref:hypothetical protein n=1 Tax=Streptomyces sp. Tu 3180 TaxID=2682611 RepID=UPI0013571863|nr:hypothetical protein [Streptomyces sp. Tu 3180]KAF3464345.1 hypothetical protein GL259_08525 [Streptomyces sp. Tu 3180]
MSAAMPSASVKSQVFESVLGFLPDWVQITVLVLIVLAVVASWAIRIRRRTAHRRAVRAGRPVHAAAGYGQGSGADHLGPYAPRPQGSGADHLGQYAPPRQQPSGADFLGAHAPRQQRQGDGPA